VLITYITSLITCIICWSHASSVDHMHYCADHICITSLITCIHLFITCITSLITCIHLLITCITSLITCIQLLITCIACGLHSCIHSFLYSAVRGYLKHRAFPYSLPSEMTQNCSGWWQVSGNVDHMHHYDDHISRLIKSWANRRKWNAANHNIRH
jgi:hypothetical protein